MSRQNGILDMEQPVRHQQQLRSNSISGQDFQYHHRVRHSPMNSNPFYDNYNSSSYAGNPRLASRLHSSGPQQQHYISGRTSPPVNLGAQSSMIDALNYYNDGPFRHSPNERPKNQLHASLECLNSSYLEQNYKQNSLAYIQPSQVHQINAHGIAQSRAINSHYATSFVLTQPPANTVINQDGETDLAAAAMGNPPIQANQRFVSSASPAQQQHQQHHYQMQNLLNRASCHQATQSPMRRMGAFNGASATGNCPPTNNILNQLSGLPIRAGHSSLSLASSSYLIEDKLQNEIKKLRSELTSEKEKNGALNNQLNINSNLMAAFEQSLTTLNSRLRQVTALCERKDQEIAELRDQLDAQVVDKKSNGNMNSIAEGNNQLAVIETSGKTCECNHDIRFGEENDASRTIDDLKRQLIEKDRLLTDTRLEALAAAHQLEQLEARLNGEHCLLNNDDDLDEGVMVANHSPSDSDAITDSAQFSELNSQMSRSIQNNTDEVTNSSKRTSSRNESNSYFSSNFNIQTNCVSYEDETNDKTNKQNLDEQSNSSSDKSRDQLETDDRLSERERTDEEKMNKLLGSLLISS